MLQVFHTNAKRKAPNWTTSASSFGSTLSKLIRNSKHWLRFPDDRPYKFNLLQNNNTFFDINDVFELQEESVVLKHNQKKDQITKKRWIDSRDQSLHIWLLRLEFIYKWIWYSNWMIEKKKEPKKGMLYKIEQSKKKTLVSQTRAYFARFTKTSCTTWREIYQSYSWRNFLCSWWSWKWFELSFIFPTIP